MDDGTTEDGYATSAVWHRRGEQRHYPGTEDWPEEQRLRFLDSLQVVQLYGVRLTDAVVADLMAAADRPWPDVRLGSGPRGSVIYYVLFASRVKIGTTVNLPRRLAELPHDELLATEPGGYALEAQRHAEFAALRIGRTEWFHAGPALVAHVAALRG